MNKIEKSILDSLNGVTSRTCDWKLFSSRKVNSTMELKSDKEKKLYNALCEYLADKDTTISVLPCNKFSTMFIDWCNDKLIENINVIVDVKLLEKCLKYYFLENHLQLNRYFAIAMNSKDDKLYIVSVCRESGIYQIKENTTSDTSLENDTSDDIDTSDNSNMAKISKHIADIVRLSADMSTTDKIDIVKTLEKMLEVNATVNVTKKTKSA